MPVNARLVGVTGTVAGQTFSISTSPLTIGRSPDADVSLPSDASISRNHAQVYTHGGSVFLTDLGSSNGTRLNGQVITAPTLLMEGDLITCGAQSLRFEGEVPPFPTDAPGTLRDALKQVPDFATRFRMIENDMKRNPSRHWRSRLAATVILLIVSYLYLSSVFSGLPFGGDKNKTRDLRQSLRVGMSMDDVREIAGNPDSKSVYDGSIGHTEMWTYNGLSVFVHFSPYGRVEAIQTME